MATKTPKIPTRLCSKAPVSVVSTAVWALIDAGTHEFSRYTALLNSCFDEAGGFVLNPCLDEDGREIITSYRLRRVALKARPLCGAKGKRTGAPCQARVALKPDRSLAPRCRLHGGRSTGPRTAQGRAAIAESNRRRATSNSLGREMAEK